MSIVLLIVSIFAVIGVIYVLGALYTLISEEFFDLCEGLTVAFICLVCIASFCFVVYGVYEILLKVTHQ